jgi:phage-related protein
MPLPISSIAIEEKNKLATDSVWMICMRLTIPGASPTYVHVVKNTENITWPTGGQVWQAFPFDIEPIPAEGKGEVPKVEVSVSNVTRALEIYVLAYDTYIKTAGFDPIIVDLYLINSKNLASATPEVWHQFELKSPKMTATMATFTLGASNPYSKRFPQDRILKDHCRHRFKDSRCKYVGGGSTCSKTFAACTAYANTLNYGGFPGAGLGGLRLR